MKIKNNLFARIRGPNSELHFHNENKPGGEPLTGPLAGGDSHSTPTPQVSLSRCLSASASPKASPFRCLPPGLSLSTSLWLSSVFLLQGPNLIDQSIVNISTN